jgi:hypothetical protein
VNDFLFKAREMTMGMTMSESEALFIGFPMV